MEEVDDVTSAIGVKREQSGRGNRVLLEDV